MQMILHVVYRPLHIFKFWRALFITIFILLLLDKLFNNCFSLLVIKGYILVKWSNDEKGNMELWV